MTTKELGDLGEKLVCEYLVKNGYSILAKKYRITFGEIDIIAQKKWRFRHVLIKNFSTSLSPSIHFVEVKTIMKDNDSFYSGQSGGFFPEQKVDYRKQRKLIWLAEIWLAKNKLPENTPYQIDIIAVSENKIDFFENVVDRT